MYCKWQDTDIKVILFYRTCKERIHKHFFIMIVSCIENHKHTTRDKGEKNNELYVTKKLKLITGFKKLSTFK